ncbi:MAG: hypothetical protein BGO78_05050 [Chloroflexi bacterium 44-23]|nr:MAG: hypothetical protein BGO78_05050 [Chloroflexi bacterium 44-23]
MIMIGELAKRGNVTVKALQNYAHLGLLKPVWIDRFSGYRYYYESQLMQLQRIQVLKDMGFALRQIQSLLVAAGRSYIRRCASFNPCPKARGAFLPYPGRAGATLRLDSPLE